MMLTLFLTHKKAHFLKMVVFRVFVEALQASVISNTVCLLKSNFVNFLTIKGRP